MAINIFGFEIKKVDKTKNAVSIVPPEPDGAVTVETGLGGGAFASQSIVLSSTALSEKKLIESYRKLSLLPEVESAIDDIVNESLVTGELKQSVSINLDNVDDMSENIKKIITDEFESILKLLNFKKDGYEIFKRFYIDGRLYYDKVVNESKPKDGILELRQIDSLQIQKIREVIKKVDPKSGIEVEDRIEEFFVYVPRAKNIRTGPASVTLIPTQQIQVNADRISFIHSGLIDEKEFILSHLHKVIKPSNQLQLIEDSTVIYRLSRAPERRAFYIDVGNLPKVKAEQYLRDVKTQFESKIQYNADTGEVINSNHQLSMLEDFFLARREGGRGTEIQTLDGGKTLGETEDTDYFKKKLYRALNVPFSRVESDSTFNLGRSAEITRDEVKFSKFITRLRTRFNELFQDLLKTQLILKGVMKPSEWEEIKQEIEYDYISDSQFSELKEIEIMQGRFEALSNINDFVGVYVSKDWVRKNVLRQTDEEIEEIDKQIKKEEASGELEDVKAIDEPNDGDAGEGPPEEEPKEPKEPKEPEEGEEGEE